MRGERDGPRHQDWNLGIYVSDPAHSEAFYTRIFGLRTTEYNHLGLIFMRAGRDHHDLLLFPVPPGKKLGLEHIAFEVAHVADFLEVVETLKRNQVTIVRGRAGAIRATTSTSTSSIPTGT